MASVAALNGQFQLPPFVPLSRTGIVHKLALMLVALTVASGAVVFNEPAPVDALTMGLIVLLPAIGLVSIRPSMVVILSLLLVCAACAFFASTLATDVGTALTHTTISLYLYLAAFTFAAFVAKNPARHATLILNAYAAAALFAALAGVVGYFDLVPGSADILTKFGRATGPFKDPNVFGAFLVLAVVYELHRAVTSRGLWSLVHFGTFCVLVFAVLLSVSRGAWATTAVAILLYGILSFLTAKRHIERTKLLGLAAAGVLSAALIIGAATKVDKISGLLNERAQITNSYDEGPDGRFGGHDKAIELILTHPAGIGALEFHTSYHSEDVHQTYLNMFLNAGWVGGSIYILVIAMTMVWGLRHAFRRTATQPLYIVAYSAFAGMVMLGFLIDTDHWRHFYLIAGIVWGLVIADRAISRSQPSPSRPARALLA